MKIEKITLKDINQLNHLQPEGWTSLISKFEFYTTNDHCYPIKLVLNGKIVGIGSTIIHDNSAWLAHIIVDINHRNKGFGKIITQKLIDKANENNCLTISLIATELGAFVYEKLGFVTETEYIFYKVSLNHEKFKSDKIFPYSIDFKEQIINLDKKISKENRFKTIENHLENAVLYILNGKVEGFLLPTLGEGLIIALNKYAGMELIKFRLNTHENAIFPVENITAKEYFENLNHKVVYKAKRMKLGKDNNIDFSKIYARIGGYLG